MALIWLLVLSLAAFAQGARQLKVSQHGSSDGQAIRASSTVGYPYGPPSKPPRPDSDLLPFTSGDIIDFKSKHYDLYCNVAQAHESHPDAIRCSDKHPDTVSKGFLVIGDGYMTNKLYDGDGITLKSQVANHICKALATEGGRIVCKETTNWDHSATIIARKGTTRHTIRLEVKALEAGEEEGGQESASRRPLVVCYPSDGPSHYLHCGPLPERAPLRLADLLVVKPGGGGGDYPPYPGGPPH